MSKILDQGTSNLIVARIGYQLGELSKLCQINEEKKSDLSDIFHDLMKAILAADQEASPLIEELIAIEDEVSKNGIQLQQHGSVIPSSLKLDTIKVFLKHAKEALKLLAQALAIFFDKGWTEAKFEPILEYAKKKQDERYEVRKLVQLLHENLSWLSDILRLRNMDEHNNHKREKKKPLVENYQLSTVQGRLSLIRPRLCNNKEVLPFLLDANKRLFILCEELLVSTIALFLPSPVSICEIPVAQRQKNNPQRYKHCLGNISSHSHDLTSRLF